MKKKTKAAARVANKRYIAGVQKNLNNLAGYQFDDGVAQIEGLNPAGPAVVFVDTVRLPKRGHPVLYTDPNGNTKAKLFDRALLLVNDGNGGEERFDNDGVILGTIKGIYISYSCFLIFAAAF